MILERAENGTPQKYKAQMKENGTQVECDLLIIEWKFKPAIGIKSEIAQCTRVFPVFVPSVHYKVLQVGGNAYLRFPSADIIINSMHRKLVFVVVVLCILNRKWTVAAAAMANTLRFKSEKRFGYTYVIPDAKETKYMYYTIRMLEEQ